MTTASAKNALAAKLEKLAVRDAIAWARSPQGRALIAKEAVRVAAWLGLAEILRAAGVPL